MRNTFINELTTIAATDRRIWLVCGDLGYSVLDDFAKRYPERFLNAGVAEQNMTGMAVGLAMEDRTVFTYSIANFPTMRCLEQIRNDVCYHQANVKIVSVGAGVAYGTHGYSHFGVEDLAVLRSLPHLRILSPADPVEAVRAVRLAVDHPGPVYVRLGKNGEPRLHAAPLDYGWGEPVSLLETVGGILVLSTGSVAYHAFQAARDLRGRGMDVGFATLPSFKPFPADWLRSQSRAVRAIVTVEEHVPHGGLYSVVAEQLAGIPVHPPVHGLALPAAPGEIGSQSYLLSRAGLDAVGIARSIEALGGALTPR